MTLIDDIIAHIEAGHAEDVEAIKDATALRDVLAANEATIAAQDAELRDLRAYSAAQAGQITALEAKVGELDEVNADLVALNRELVHDGMDLTDKVAALEQTVTEQAARIAELEGGVEPPAPAAQWRVVNVGSAGLNVRSAPVVGNNILGKLPDGTVVEELERDGDWLRHADGWSAIVYRGVTYLEPVEPAPPDEPYHPSTTEYEGVPIIGERWDGVVLAGAGTADPGTWQLAPDALAAIETAKLDAVKVMIPGFGWPEMTKLRNIKSDMFVVGRLIAPDDKLASPAAFAEYIRPHLYSAYDAGLRFVEVHNEPNLPGEGMGRHWHNGGEFAAWWIEVVERLAPQFPGVKWGFPGLSPSVGHESYWNFMQDARSAVERAAWLGCHVYWQNAGEWLPAAQALHQFAEHYRGRMVLCTEFSRQAGTDMAAKGAEYVEFYNHVHRGNVVALFAFVLSASSGWETEKWVGSPIPEIVGKRDEEKETEE